MLGEKWGTGPSGPLKQQVPAPPPSLSLGVTVDLHPVVLGVEWEALGDGGYTGLG